MRVVNNYVPMVTTDEKVMICINIVLEKIFNEYCTSKRGKFITNYKFKKQLKDI